MPISPIDFDRHKDRIRSFDDEISRRCAISRGYYYAFHATRERGSNHPRGNFNYGPGDHGNAKTFLRRAVDKTFADELDDLHEKRKKADYELDEDVDDMYLAVFEKELEDFIIRLKQEL